MKEIYIDGFVINGPSLRTNNIQEASAEAKIPALWENFYTSQTEPSAKVYGVYTNYESDATGEYTVYVGSKTNGDKENTIDINSAIYLAFPANGEMPAAVIDAWKNIWEYFSKAQPYIRSFKTDFEEYSGPESAVIYIGIETEK